MSEAAPRIVTSDRERKKLLDLALPGGRSVRPRMPAEAALSLIAQAVRRDVPKDLLIYLHVPFCSSKCLFCDWVADVPVGQLRGDVGMRRAYVEALVRQIHFMGPRLTDLGYTPRHIYWGGGTPSKLEAEDFGEVLAALETSFDLRFIDEHTLESSPETLTEPKLKALLAAGMNRLSMGIQSFNDGELRRSGRSHSARQAEDAVAMIREAGVKNWNLDVIVALPDQTVDMLQHTLERLVAADATHVSTYVYRASPQTVMADQMGKGYREAVGFNKIYRSYGLAQKALLAAGYEEYSFGYFAKAPQFRFKGEAYYYEFHGDYIGFGSGAGSILGHHYFKNESDDLHRFIGDPLQFDHGLRLSALRVDLVVDPLRLALLTDSGIQYQSFRRTFGYDFDQIRGSSQFVSYLKACRDAGVVFVEASDRLSVTPESRIWLLLAS